MLSTTVAKRNMVKKNDTSIYMMNMLTRKIHLNFNSVGKNLKETLEKKVRRDIEGKCSVEGFIKPNSIKVLSYSSGILVENQVMFEVVFECMVCCPVEGMHIKCNVQNITQAGIRAFVKDDISPVIVYISRDHHYNNKYFSTVKENDEITIKVIGQRYELNDPHVSVIGEIMEPKNENYKKKTKPKLVIKNA